MELIATPAGSIAEKEYGMTYKLVASVGANSDTDIAPSRLASLGVLVVHPRASVSHYRADFAVQVLLAQRT